ncbi:hypothetical protein E4U54_001670 [Claviceps lovelessii]|nr:hypothetical protein E4U54_001670 [Claviceps lovelessii]
MTNHSSGPSSKAVVGRERQMLKRNVQDAFAAGTSMFGKSFSFDGLRDAVACSCQWVVPASVQWMPSVDMWSPITYQPVDSLRGAGGQGPRPLPQQC